MDELLGIRQLNRMPVINFLFTNFITRPSSTDLLKQNVLRDAFTYVSLYYGANLHQHELVMVSLHELNCQF